MSDVIFVFFLQMPLVAMGNITQVIVIVGSGATKRTVDGIDHVSEEIGEKIAKTYNDAVVNSAYIKGGYFTENSVPLEILNKSELKFSLDFLVDPVASEERKLLIDLFFGLSLKGQTDRSLLRKHTLSLHTPYHLRAPEAPFACAAQETGDVPPLCPSLFQCLTSEG